MSNVFALDTPASGDAEKDAPLREDIRLLGRLLGDTVREQEGGEVFALVERIRQASIRFHRDNEVGARRELAATLDSLDSDQTLVPFSTDEAINGVISGREDAFVHEIAEFGRRYGAIVRADHELFVDAFRNRMFGI